jgi:hypothetical protein
MSVDTTVAFSTRVFGAVDSDTKTAAACSKNYEDKLLGSAESMLSLASSPGMVSSIRVRF